MTATNDDVIKHVTKKTGEIKHHISTVYGHADSTGKRVLNWWEKEHFRFAGGVLIALALMALGDAIAVLAIF